MTTARQSQRIRAGRAYHAAWHSKHGAAARERAIELGGFSAWESFAVIYPDGTVVNGAYVVWVPDERPAPPAPPPPLAPPAPPAREDDLLVEAPSGASHRYITRLDFPDKQMVGWLVRFTRDGQSYRSYFSDANQGGYQAALDAAITWRNTRLEEVERDPSAPNPIAESKHSNTGIRGIRRRVEGLGTFYEAQWTGLDGKRKSRSFSIAVYGEQGAKERAIAARIAGMAQPKDKE